MLSSKRETAKIDLSLSGSQINLSNRPRTGSGKASVRSLAVSAVHSKRPVSAMPSLGHQGSNATAQCGDWKRPQSADNPYYSGGDFSFSSSIPTPESDFLDEGKEQPHIRRRNKLAAKFPLLENELQHEVVDRERNEGLTPDLEAYYSLCSSKPSNTDEASQLGNGVACSCESEIDLESSRSEEHCQSEASLGERIIAMAQNANLNALKPGLTTKPPLPHYYRTSVQSTSINIPHSYSSDERKIFHCLQHESYVGSNSGSSDKLAEEVYDYLSLSSKEYLPRSLQIANNNTRDLKIKENDTPDFLSIQPICHLNNIRESIHVPEEKPFPNTLLENKTSDNEQSISHEFNEKYSHGTVIKLHDWFPTTSQEFTSIDMPTEIISQKENAENENVICEQMVSQRESILCSGSMSFSIYGKASSISELEKLQKPESDAEISLETEPHNTKICKAISITDDCDETSLTFKNKKKRLTECNNNGATMRSFEERDTSQLGTCETDEIGATVEKCKSPIVSIDASEGSKGMHKIATSESTKLVQHEYETSSYHKSSKEIPEKEGCMPVMLSDDVDATTSTVSECKMNDLEHGSLVKCSDLKAGRVNGKNTTIYEDIMYIIKVLEDEEEGLTFCNKTEELNMTPDCDSVAPTTTGLLSNDLLPVSAKLEDILTYLDAVEQSCNTTLESAKNHLQTVKDSNAKGASVKLSQMTRLEELLNMSTVDLAHEVLTLKLQLEEKSNGLSLLQETLNQQRELTLRNTRNADRDMKTRLKQQKQEYEAIINRHQKFIDQLISDKKSLSEKCESVIKELKTSEERYSTNLKASEERHNIELQRAKEMFAAAEKLRRERWIDNRTQKIKEMTVKGLEPELQRMSIRHQQELSDLRTLHKQELEEMEIRAVRRSAQQMEQLREQLTLEKEECIAKERELLRQKMEKLTAEEEVTYQEQRRRLLADVRREKERITEEEERTKDRLEETKQNLVREHARDLERVKREYEESLEAIMRRHQNEMKAVRDALEIEKEAWIHNYKKQQSALILEREGELREQFKKERDREIELVIERLENEAMHVRAEQEQAADNRLRRLKDKFDAEIKDLETSEEALKSKYNLTKSKLVEREDELIKLKANVRQLQTELQESRKIADRLSAERAEVKDIIRNEFVQQITSMEQENMKHKEEMAELKTKHQMEITSKVEELNRVKADKEKELDEVYNRVKLTIAKKDKALQQVKLQHESALQRCVHLEELLEQQRRDFLLK